jgi:hypothetical protein
MRFTRAQLAADFVEHTSRDPFVRNLRRVVTAITTKVQTVSGQTDGGKT